MQRASCAIPLLLLTMTTSLFSQSAKAIQEKYTTITSGIRIHYLESGDQRSKRSLVLIPGWRLPAYLWKGQLETFGPMIRVIAVDPRSQGSSTKTAENNTPETRAQDMYAILRALGISDPILVGWSQGSQDVAAYLQQFGVESVAAVVFVDSAVTASPAEIEIHPQFSKVILSNLALYASHPKAMSEGMVHSIFKQPHPELDLAALVQFTLETPTDSGIAMLVSDIFGIDRRPILRKLRKPCLVIGAADNPLIDIEREMATTIPGAKFIVIKDAAHAIFIDQPSVFNDALRNLLESLSMPQKGTAAPGM